VQVSSVIISKTGKHGHSKASIVAFDLFTGKRLEDSQPSSHTMRMPVVTLRELVVVDVRAGVASLLDANNGQMREAHIPPVQVSDESEISKYEKLVAEFAAGKTVTVCLMSAMGEEMLLPHGKAE
jgi:translation initiation factor 5A